MASSKHTPIGEVGKALEKAFDASTRKTVLNIRYHCMPINLRVYRRVLKKYLRTETDLDLGDAGEVRTIEQIIDEIKAYVLDKKNFKNPVIEISDPNSWQVLVESKSTDIAKLTREKAILPAVLTLNNEVVGVLFSSYNSAYDNLFRDYISKVTAKYLKKAHYEAQAVANIAAGKSAGSTVPGLDLGHFAAASTSAPYLVSPELLKLDLVGKQLASIMTNTSDNEKLGILNQIKIAIDSSREQLTKATRADRLDGFLEKDFSQFLVKIKAVVIIPQDRIENRVYFGSRLEGVIDATISSMLKVNFSRNFIDEIEYRVVSGIKGLKVETSKVTKNLPTINLTPNKTSTQITGSNASGGSSNITGIKGTSTSNYSLTSLQNLINTHLQDVISANMGSGGQRNVLNYRTGRFASTVQVEKMSQSREGMITAFYSYMKNPYQTFEPGFRQGSPKTRDPKLLVARSIREIAETKVANRMRAVSL
jgi:hypothetical protein